jgi:hypothetical protein
MRLKSRPTGRTAEKIDNFLTYQPGRGIVFQKNAAGFAQIAQ